MADSRIERVVVVVPARDEAGTIVHTLAAIRAAAQLLPTRIAVEVVVVANACTDDTAARVRGAGAHVVVESRPGVGRARALGCAWALSRSPGPDRLWIATTDADSTVPVSWLRAQLSAADAGADVFLGTVRLSPQDEVGHASWVEAYERRSVGPHGHLHGANMGFRAAAYVASGGFADLDLHEDADLAARLVASGPVAWDRSVAVTTSARHVGRVVGGVATDLAGADRLTAPAGP